MAKEYIEKWAAINALTAEALERNLDRVPTDDASRYHRAAERVIAGIPAANVREVSPVLTKGDEIRAMSDNEIADWMDDNMPCRQNCPAKRPMCSDRCYNAWLDWLKSTVEVEEC